MVYLQQIRSAVCAIKSRMGPWRWLFWGCFGVVREFVAGLGLVFGVGCRNDATKMHNVAGDFLNPTQRYEKFLKYANIGG